MKKVRSIGPFLTKLMVTGILLSAGWACKDDDPVNPKTITDVVFDSPDFTILGTAIRYAGMSDALKTQDLTFFAPNDAAFKASGFADAAAITARPAAEIREILKYHIIGTALTVDQLEAQGTPSYQNLAMKPTYITRNSGGVLINGVRITTPNMKADNGIIHVVERLLMPPTKSLLEIIQSNSDLTFLLAAATRAAQTNPTLGNALSSPLSTYTLLAPSNAAFMAAGFTSTASFNAADPTTLANILLYHVLPGRIFSNNFTSGTLTTVSTKTIKVDVNNGVKITGNKNTAPATLTQTNLLATNGVIHIIDRVLMP
ncbi:fasciclin domain-containing protein [Salmonirosea aquatica]|uniref:Fasciclin domain-containing protein n=1 Tax=Salmonirosea aquatica TaxID=2654236 RepID=A0A7C9FD97_9BACT|nr:fasciclin domain-containing protein [Cytophagaceae bacterium SJW1-29]